MPELARFVNESSTPDRTRFASFMVIFIFTLDNLEKDFGAPGEAYTLTDPPGWGFAAQALWSISDSLTVVLTFYAVIYVFNSDNLFNEFTLRRLCMFGMLTRLLTYVVHQWIFHTMYWLGLFTDSTTASHTDVFDRIPYYTLIVTTRTIIVFVLNPLALWFFTFEKRPRIGNDMPLSNVTPNVAMPRRKSTITLDRSRPTNASRLRVY